jgi:hypothetical protein
VWPATSRAPPAQPLNPQSVCLVSPESIFSPVPAFNVLIATVWLATTTINSVLNANQASPHRMEPAKLVQPTVRHVTLTDPGYAMLGVVRSDTVECGLTLAPNAWKAAQSATKPTSQTVSAARQVHIAVQESALFALFHVPPVPLPQSARAALQDLS